MADLTESVDALKDRRLPVVAKATGIHVNTVRAIARGENTSPRYNTILELSDYLFPRRGGPEDE